MTPGIFDHFYYADAALPLRKLVKLTASLHCAALVNAKVLSNINVLSYGGFDVNVVLRIAKRLRYGTATNDKTRRLRQAKLKD